ncbi:TetR/AcrR family transcriptional regulator [Moritella sp. F3]|uniref:TetR/AcrR family transcriptional regulator n=1 Tax=Moritella sp. F3 TaxID=2718882 RepID=UPI0018E1CEBF|nr:TetR/AcrR family transcriptional regulator [Moritella sp. F3]GIC78655.1 TetR family transcriptional regulator [Moritella sp. F1]GIC79806.1 TetR family transcriptional regulator [Moritella sp. F3]
MVDIRDSELTRQTILDITAGEMWQHGYKATSLSEIIKKANVSKGALYHHFKNKQALGYAVFEEIFAAQFHEMFEPVLAQDDAITALTELFAVMPSMGCEEDMIGGCPVNTISQEMSSQDEGFRELANNMYQKKVRMFAESFERMQQSGSIKQDVDCRSSALLIVSCFQGMMSLIKVSRDKQQMIDLLDGMKNYLNGLRA